MEVIETNIKDVLIIEPRVFKDARGYFFESFSKREFDEKVTPILGHSVNFVQDNESMSSYGVMRGLHFQRPPFTQSKLVRCVKGAVLDVAVDIRKGSPTYGQHVSCLLCGNEYADIENQKKLASTTCAERVEVALTCDEIANAVNRQFFIAKGFAHGFAVLSETVVFQYKCDEFYHSEADGGISIVDESLGINWHLPGHGLPPKQGDERGSALLSEKDTKHKLLKDFDSPFDINVSLY